jgi:thiamine biosynthesis lipoprotein
MQRLEFRAMGCQMLALVDSPNVVDQINQVPAWFEEWEQSLSRFRADSELNRLNRNAGQPVPVSAVLWQVIQASLQAARESGGIVTPALLGALESAGYDRTFELLEPSAARQRPGWMLVGDWRMIECDAAARSICLPSGIRLDLGGIAKGWAADQAARRLAMCAPALIDAGGDIAVSGPRANGDPWLIGVADPGEPARNLELLMIAQGAVATSGRDYRRWQRNGIWQHHIIDPRTGEPAETDVVAATVIAPTALAAEVAAKMILILGSRAGLGWLEARSTLAGLLVLEGGYVVHSQRLENYLVSTQ